LFISLNPNPLLTLTHPYKHLFFFLPASFAGAAVFCIFPAGRSCFTSFAGAAAFLSGVAGFAVLLQL
jgi:hypothetical protein